MSRALQCDYSVGIDIARCPAEATYWRYTYVRPNAYRKTKACWHHRYPVGQYTDTDVIYAKEMQP